MAVASGDAGGFECSFIGDVKEFECPLCLHVTKDPNLTSCCGQHFCQSCISRIITDRKPCPFCKETVFSVFLDKKQKRRVLDLKVKCSECSRGCSWTGTLGDLDNHGIKDCGFKNVRCPNDCSMEVQRRLVEDHLANKCQKRNVVCKYCGYQDTYILIIRKHISECPKYPVSCANNCTPNTFVRATLKKHIEEVCPLQQVDCEYKSFGCTIVILRKDLAKHMEGNIQQHMLLMTKELKATKETLSGVIVELNTTKAKLSGATNELNTTKAKLSGATNELNTTKAKLSEAERSMVYLMGKVNLLENKILMVPFTFYVDGFSQPKYPNEVLGQFKFITHMNGYRLDLTCTANNGCILFNIGKVATENDNLLRWPLRCTVIISILNQNNNQVHMTMNTDVCIENNIIVTILMFDITDAEVVRAIANNRLLFKLGIVNVV